METVKDVIDRLESGYVTFDSDHPAGSITVSVQDSISHPYAVQVSGERVNCLTAAEAAMEVSRIRRERD